MGVGIGTGIDAGFSIPSAYLGGFGYPFKLGSFFMNTYVAYKLHAFEEVSHDAQWTFTWNVTFANDKLSLGGFDLWTENKDRLGTGETGKKLVLLSEPQIGITSRPISPLGAK